MSTGNDNNTNGVDPRAIEEQANGVPSISSPTKVNQEHPKNETAALAKTLTPPQTSETKATVTGNSTQTKEELQAKILQTSTNSNTDSAQTNANKSGGAQSSKFPKLKRLSTAIGRGLNWGSRKQQGRENDPNVLHEDVEIQSKNNSAIDSQPKPEKEEKIPGQHRATDLPQNKEDSLAAQHSAPNEQPADPLSIMTGYIHVETEEPEKVPDHEMEIPSLTKLVAENNTAITSLTKLVTEQKTTLASLTKLVVENNTAIASLTKLVAGQNTAIAPLKAWNDLGSPTSNNKTREIKSVLREDELTTSPIQERPGDLVFRKADGISLTEVANLVRELNAQIDQAASLIMDLLPSLESSSSDKDPEIAEDGLRDDPPDYLGSWLCGKLQHRSEEPEIDQTVAQIALQAGLVYACSRIINEWNPPFWTDGLAFSHVYDNMAGGEGPITADTWRALTRDYMTLHDDQLEANKKYLEEELLKLISAVGGSLQSGKTLLQQCHDKMDDIAKKAIDIHQVISREARSTDLTTFTIDSGADFDQSQMEDTEESDSKAGPTLPSKVICTVEMGLRGKKRGPSRQQSGDGKVGGGVTLKAKVVLPATLGEL